MEYRNFNRVKGIYRKDKGKGGEWGREGRNGGGTEIFDKGRK